MPSPTTSNSHNRFLEILPGLLTWGTLLGAPVLAYFHPVWISLFIILFDAFWFLKGANVAVHLVHSYRELKIHKLVDWRQMLVSLTSVSKFEAYVQGQIQQTSDKKLIELYENELAAVKILPRDRNWDWTKIYQLVLLATVEEDLRLLDNSIASYAHADYDTSKIFFVLATEQRAGEAAQERGRILKEKYEKFFGLFMITQHPDNLPGEIKGKAGNMNFAVNAARKEIDARGIPYEDIIVSTFDSDTIVDPNYFAHLTYDFLTAEKPLQVSFQPMPVYHNNIWETPAIARVIAASSSFWQMIEASRPDRLVTFASHSMSFKTLLDVGLFMKDSVNEDSFIFWQCLNYFNGDYRSKPLFTTVSLDAVQGVNFWATMIAQYKQKRRWAYGVTQITFVWGDVWKNKAIPLWKRFIYAERFLEGHYFWSTASIMIAILGWLPLIFGGNRFGNTVLALNLPILTKGIMSVATFFLLFSVYINAVILPERPKGYSWWSSFAMIWQWVFSPIVASVFGSVPAIDAQTRLMFGKYMESFWITPKFRKPEVENSSGKIKPQHI